MKRSIVVLLGFLLLTATLAIVPGAAFGPRADPTAPFDKLSTRVLETVSQGGDSVAILVETLSPDYAPLVNRIESLGGSVGFQYQFINAISAVVPSNSILSLADHPLVLNVYLDELREVQAGSDQVSLTGKGSSSKSSLNSDYLDSLVRGDAIPIDRKAGVGDTVTIPSEQFPLFDKATYANPMTMNAEPVWATGNFGQGSLAVIIDTGIYSDHFMFGPGQVVGGVDMSPDVGTPFEGFDRPDNHWHGSHVAGILAGHGAILTHSSSLLYQAIARYGSPPQQASTLGFPGYHIIPLFGLAPASDLYIIKVFPHTGAGVSESRIIAAINHAIGLKTGGILDVDVISMSLGGATLFDGRDLEDMTVDAASSAGIAVISAAGNDGPAPTTIGSPGSANSGMAVAAAAHPINTRVFWDLNFGKPGIGHSLFVSKTPQIYAFSSRGPTSDGRDKPDVAATGLFVLSAFPSLSSPHGLAFASGTSMATPAVSGAVSLLNAYAEVSVPGATPEDYKQAVKGGAVWLDGYGSHDQGAGYLNAWNALVALQNDPSYGDVATPLGPSPGLYDITNVPIVGSGTFSDDIKKLGPGKARTYVFEATAATDSITVSLTNVDVNKRNPLGLNSFEVYIQSAKRTTYAYYIDSANVWGDAAFEVTDDETTWSGAVTGVFFDPFTRRAPIEPGFVKVVIENDWTSKGKTSADVTIAVTTGPPHFTPDIVIGAAIPPGATHAYGLFIPPAGTTETVVGLTWENDWTAYPTVDLDLIIFWFDGVVVHLNIDGATLNSPERARIPDTAVWVFILVDGFAVPTGVPEPYVLTVDFVT